MGRRIARHDELGRAPIGGFYNRLGQAKPTRMKKCSQKLIIILFKIEIKAL